MVLLGLLTLELVLLFFIARALTSRVYLLVFLLTRNRTFAMTVVILLLFPGTVIHELAHLFTAEILGVRTGKLTLAPESVRGTEIQAGSLTMVKTDPLRKTLIGIAPLIIGLVAFSVVSYWIPGLMNGQSRLLLIGAFYLLFAISNSLFPSSLDLVGTPATFIVLGLVVVAAYVTGVRISLNGQALLVADRILTALVQSTGIVLALDGGLLLLVWVLIVLLGSLQNFKKR